LREVGEDAIFIFHMWEYRCRHRCGDLCHDFRASRTSVKLSLKFDIFSQKLTSSWEVSVLFPCFSLKRLPDMFKNLMKKLRCLRFSTDVYPYSYNKRALGVRWDTNLIFNLSLILFSLSEKNLHVHNFFWLDFRMAFSKRPVCEKRTRVQELKITIR